MSKILKLGKLFFFLDPESVNDTEVSYEDVGRELKTTLTNPDVSEEEKKEIKEIIDMLLIFYNQLSEEDVDCLIRICTNRRVSLVIVRLLNALSDSIAYAVSEEAKLEGSEIPATVKESFDKELEELLS